MIVGRAVTVGASSWASGPSKLNVGIPGAEGSERPAGGSYGSSSSGRWIVGTAGAETVTAGGSGLGRTGKSRCSCLVSDGAFQAGSKLTMGLPARSLTAVGVGSLGLRSLLFMLVAARISSLLISLPSLVGGCSDSGAGGGVATLLVYGAAFGCSACFLRLSNGFGRAFGTEDIVSALCGSG